MNKYKKLYVLFIFLFLAIIFGFILNKTYKINTTILLKPSSNQEYLFLYDLDGQTKYNKVVPNDSIISVNVPLKADKINLKTYDNNEVLNTEIESIFINYKEVNNFDNFYNIKKDLKYKFYIFPFSIVLLTFLLTFLINKYLYVEREKTFDFFKAKKNTIAKIVVFLFFACFIFVIFPFKYPLTGTIDYSWQYAINHFFNNPAFIPGKDYIFTYGPLGFIIAPLKMGHNLLIATIINLIAVIISWGYLLYLYLSKSVSLDKFAVFSVLFFMFVPFYNETLWIFITLVLAFSILKFCTENTKLALTSMILLSGISALTLFIKINLGIELLCVSGLCCLILLFDLKIKSLKYLFAFFIPYIIFLSIAIKFLFLNISNFINWFILSLDIASGYSAAMSLIGHYSHLFLAIILLLILLYILFKSYKSDKLTFRNSLILSIVFFFSFKHGFIRQDSVHIILFFIPIFYGFALLFLFAEIFNKIRVILFTITLFICIFGIKNYIDSNNLNFLFIKSIVKYNELSNNTYNYIDNGILYLYPKINIHNNESYEIIPWHIVYAKYYNPEKLKVNPFLQFYSIYTNKLDNYSANYYTTNSTNILIAENFVINNRNMYLDTPRTWNAILANYKVKEFDKRYLILDKKSSPDKYELKYMGSMIYKINKPITLPQTDSVLYAKIYIKPTILEKIKRLIFRGSPILLDIKHLDNTRVKYRAIETMFNTPVIINYIPMGNESTEDWKSLFDNNFDKIKKVSEIQFIANKLFYSESFKIEWYERE